MKNLCFSIVMVLVLILCFSNVGFSQCDINLGCTDDVFLNSDPPVFDAATNTIFLNNIEFGNYSCDEATYASGMVVYVYQLLPDGSRMNQCTVLGEPPFNVVGNVILDFGQSTFCNTSIPIGTIPLPPSEGFEACDGALLEVEVVIYVTENTGIDVQNSSIYSQLPESQYLITNLGTVEININNEFPGNGQPLTSAILRDFDSQEEGPQTLSCGDDVELYVEGLSRLANCTPYEDISTGIPSELINEFYYQINNGEPIIIADESTGAKGGQLSGPDTNLNGLCYAGLLNSEAPYTLEYSELPPDLCDGSEIIFTLKTTDIFTDQTAEDTYTVIYFGGCVVCANAGCTDPCDPNFDPDATENDPSACEGYNTTCDDGDCSTIDTYDMVACNCSNTPDPNLPLDCDDSDCNTTDSYDETTCTCINTVVTVDPNDNCEFTDDNYDPATCTVSNVSNCPAGTNLDIANCVCTTIEVDGCLDPCDPAYNPDSTNDDLCEGYSTDCDDMDCATIDTYDFDNCACINTPNPDLPLDCDDSDCATIDTYDESTCSCSNTPDPNLPLDCDDSDCATIDAYDESTCSCSNTPDPNLPLVCDDGDCSNGEETYDATTCSCDAGTPPTCADGERFNAETCLCELIPPTCDDPCATNFGEEGDCEAYSTNCDDSNCATIDAYDFDNCICTNMPDPNLPLDCDDGDCSTIDSYDETTCTCVNETDPDLPLDCNDGDCSTIDAYDAITCSCSNTPDPNLPLDCDDGDCSNGEETYNETTCSCDAGTPPTCADGERFNAETCMCEPIPATCDDPCAANFGEEGDCEAYSTNCDDDDCATIDAYDFDSCNCTNTPDPNLPLDCDDNDDCTIDSYDESTCTCMNLLPPSMGCECAAYPNCPGCTNPCAVNYDPYAVLDDESCIFPDADDNCDITIDTYDDVNCIIVNTPDCPDGSSFDEFDCICLGDPVPGCIDPAACNFNINANVDDGSCNIPGGTCEVCDGDNVVVNDADGDGVCDTDEVSGCMDDTACDYDPAATDPFPCSYNDCEGNCGGDAGPGTECTDEFGNTSAYLDDCSCPPENIALEGCTDSAACNYDATATVDNGTCILVEAGSITLADGSTETQICIDDDIDEPIDIAIVDAGQAPNGAWVITDSDANILALPDGPPFVLDGAGLGTCLIIWWLNFDDLTGAEVGANAGDLTGCFALSNSLTVNRVECDGGGVDGCTDSAACNYNPAATNDDGSCQYNDCEGNCGGSAVVGGPCDDGDPNTENDAYNANCECIGLGGDCMSAGGTLTLVEGGAYGGMNYVCAGECATVSAGDFLLQQGQGVKIVWHTGGEIDGTNIPPANILGSGSFYCNEAGIKQTVYATAFGATKDTNDEIDYGDYCLTFSNTIAITFLSPISILVDTQCDDSNGNFTYTFSVDGGLPECVPGESYVVTGDYFNGEIAAGETQSVGPIADGTSFNIAVTDPNGCEETYNDEVTCTKLPIVLELFTGDAINQGNLIKWVTSTEINNDYFNVEASTNGVNFKTIATIAGNGNSSTPIAYDYLDRAAAKGTTYYRLVQTDFDGTQSKSNVIDVTRGEVAFNITELYPIPTTDLITLQFVAPDQSAINIEVFDLIGHTLLEYERTTAGGITQMDINVAHLPAGVYFISIISNNDKVTQKFVIE